MVTPLLRLLHRSHPEAEIDMLASVMAAPLLEMNAHIANLYRLRARNWPLALSPEKHRLIHQLRSRKYDLALLLESAPRYRRLLERIGAGRICSFSEVPFDPSLHAIVNNMRVAGIHSRTEEDLDMELPLSAEDDAIGIEMIRDLRRPCIGVHIGWGPGRRKRQQENRLRGWKPANVVRLISSILERSNGSVILTGSPEDAQDTQRIYRLLPGGRLRSIAGRTNVRQAAAVIKNLDLLVSVDSGPCHMAAALGTPLVVLWGPGRLEQTRPVSSHSPIRIVRHQLPCAPCQSTPQQKVCRQNLCMDAITPDEVFLEVRNLLRLNG
jgi:ADP-heptose:LPS heptosyltransferase